jgi:hypothetical protein
MKKKLIVISIVVACFALTTGMVGAASFRNITKKLGGNAGDTFVVDGSMVMNGLKVTGGSQFLGSFSNPKGDLVIGDNVRIDGKVYSGKTAGIGDSRPLVVNDDMRVDGYLTVSGTITGSMAYDHTVSGLTATTVKGAIDELGVKLGNLIGGAAFTATAGVHKAALTATTWKGNFYSYNKGTSDTNPCTYSTSEEITVVFTPTTDTAGTFTSTPFYAFHPFYDVTSGCAATTTYRSTTPFTGNYHIIGNNIFIDSTINTVANYSSARVEVRGNTMTIVDASMLPGPVITLTRQ